MIITLIGIILIVLGIICFIIYYNSTSLSWKTEDSILGISIFSSLIGGIITLVALVYIISAHWAVNKQIYDASMERSSIIKQIEYINTNYEDISKVTVIQNVYEWNKKVHDAQYWSKNPWTNWFYSEDYVDSLYYIETEEFE